MINIQSPNFIENFNMKDATVGTVGYGFIGNAVVELFKPHCKVLIYDKARPELNTLDEVVLNSEVIFIAVPTPMKKSGECHTGIVESVLQEIQNTATKLERDLGSFIVVIKSTVPPGFTNKMQDRFALRIVFSPEFLTEANAVNDFKTTNRVLLGGDFEDAQVVYKYFEGVWPNRMMNTYDNHKDGIVQIVQCDAAEAEMVKLSTNAHLMSKVLLANELYLICQKLGVDYDNVKIMTQLDRRIGLSHMSVPGPDGSLGAGGHCFPKDINNLVYICKQLGTNEKMFSAVQQRNLEIREDKDWEKMEGRAVINE